MHTATHILCLLGSLGRLGGLIAMRRLGMETSWQENASRLQHGLFDEEDPPVNGGFPLQGTTSGPFY